jgi:hypothetical protein
MTRCTFFGNIMQFLGLLDQCFSAHVIFVFMNA